MAVGLIWYELFMWHDAGNYPSPMVEPLQVPDTAEPKRRIRNLLEASGLMSSLVSLAPQEAREEALLSAHTHDYVQRVRQTGEAGGGDLARYARIGPKGDRIARLAAGAAILAVDAVLDGRLDSAYALVRPAGHHAGRAGGGGFCIFNNVAVAALHALVHDEARSIPAYEAVRTRVRKAAPSMHAIARALDRLEYLDRVRDAIVSRAGQFAVGVIVVLLVFRAAVLFYGVLAAGVIAVAWYLWERSGATDRLARAVDRLPAVLGPSPGAKA